MVGEARVLVKDMACFVICAEDVLNDVKPMEEVSPPLLRLSFKFQSLEAMVGGRFAELVEKSTAFLVQTFGGPLAGGRWWSLFF